MKRFWLLLAVTTGALTFGQSIVAAADAGIALPSEWRITRVVQAPWATTEPSRASLRGWVGMTIGFNLESVDGPGVLQCDHATRETTGYGADALFQGVLPKPADIAAQQVGISHFPIPGVRLNCSTGSFELHVVDPETVLLGLDNQILTLSRSPGTLASANSPEGRVQRFLELHFGGEMSFDSAGTTARSGWFSKRLGLALSDYFAKPVVIDEVPAINGDPFTDTQEPPTRFAVGKARVSDDLADVPIRFSDAFSNRALVYVMHHEGGNWLLDDIRFEGGELFSHQME